MLVTVYIRKADEKLWRELENKTQAISELLNSQQNNQSNEDKCPRHHVPVNLCAKKH